MKSIALNYPDVITDVLLLEKVLVQAQPTSYMGIPLCVTGCDRPKLVLTEKVVLYFTANYLSLGENKRICRFNKPLDLNNPIEEVYRKAEHGKSLVCFTNGYQVLVTYDPLNWNNAQAVVLDIV